MVTRNDAPQRLKPPDSSTFAARLKPCPDENRDTLIISEVSAPRAKNQLGTGESIPPESSR